jgi:hypothetical protein
VATGEAQGLVLLVVVRGVADRAFEDRHMN